MLGPSLAGDAGSDHDTEHAGHEPHGALENKIGKDRVLLGRNIEGTPDVVGGEIYGIDPLNDGYGGVFDWRVDQDTRNPPGDGPPTFQ